MKFSTAIITALCTLAYTVVAAFEGGLATDLIQGQIERGVTPFEFDYPATVRPFASRRSRINNAERMKRGMPLARPAKLYQASKRVLDAPAQAVPSGNGYLYQFSGCYGGANPAASGGWATFDITYTDTEDLVRQCAAHQEADHRGPNAGFIVFTSRGFTFNCFINAAFMFPATCDANNAASYTRTS